MLMKKPATKAYRSLAPPEDIGEREKLLDGRPVIGCHGQPQSVEEGHDGISGGDGNERSLPLLWGCF